MGDNLRGEAVKGEAVKTSLTHRWPVKAAVQTSRLTDRDRQLVGSLGPRAISRRKQIARLVFPGRDSRNTARTVASHSHTQRSCFDEAFVAAVGEAMAQTDHEALDRDADFWPAWGPPSGQRWRPPRTLLDAPCRPPLSPPHRAGNKTHRQCRRASLAFGRERRTPPGSSGCDVKEGSREFEG
jgi:hypothetical protein